MLFHAVNSEWMRSPEGAAPPSHYFCASKLNVWANTADQAEEACKATKKNMARYFEQKHKDVVSQLVGKYPRGGHSLSGGMGTLPLKWVPFFNKISVLFSQGGFLFFKKISF